MSNFELLGFQSPTALAEAVADAWMTELKAAHPAKYCVALSGGRIARAFFSAITAQAQASRAVLDPVHFFWADERCVPPDDPESNFGIAQAVLFKPLQVQPTQIHRIHGENAPALAAREAEEELRLIAPANSASSPVFDLILLGMGEDGHIASLFPGEPPETKTSAAVYRVVTAVKPPPRRITLGYHVIAAAAQVWVLVSGAGKEEAFRRSLAAEGETPLAEILRARPATRIFSDIAVQ
jgi:6-phosphogluconolactonase